MEDFAGADGVVIATAARTMYALGFGIQIESSRWVK